MKQVNIIYTKEGKISLIKNIMYTCDSNTFWKMQDWVQEESQMNSFHDITVNQVDFVSLDHLRSTR